MDRGRRFVLKAAGVALCVVLFTALGVQALQSVAAQEIPISKIRLMEAGRSSSVVYIVNGDNSVSAYDLGSKSFLFQRKVLAGDGVIDGIAASQDGSRLAVFFWAGRQYALQVAIYTLQDLAASATPAPRVSYSLQALREEAGRVRGSFSQDNKTFYVTYGEKSLLLLDSGSVNTQRISVGSGPLGMVTDAAGFVLVLNQESQELSIVDGATKSVRNVKLGQNPRALLFNKANGFAYVSHVGSDDIYVVDVKAGRVVRTLKTGADPAALEYDEGTGMVFVGNSADGTVSMIGPDFSIRTVDLRAPSYSSSYPLSLAYLKDVKRLVVLNSGLSKVFVIEIPAGTIVKEENIDVFPVDVVKVERAGAVLVRGHDADAMIILDGRTLALRNIPDVPLVAPGFFSKPQGIAIDEENNRIFISNLGNNAITVIDGTVQRAVSMIVVDAPVQSVNYNPATRKLYGYSPSIDTVYVIDTSRNDYPSKRITVGKQPLALAINQSTNRVYVSNAADATISVIDGARDVLLASVSLGKGSFPLLSAVDEKRNTIYVAAYGKDFLALIDGATNALKKTVRVGGNPIWVRYISELDRVLISVEGERQLAVLDPGSGEVVQRLTFAQIPYRIFFDERTGYVYLNFRRDRSVSVFEFDKEANGLREVRTFFAPYWGETDGPFNMARTNMKSGFSYFTFGRGNMVVVVRDELDENRLRKAVWYATILGTGEPIYSEKAREELGIRGIAQPVFEQFPWLLPVLLAVAVVAAGSLIAFILKRRKTFPTSP